MKFSMSQSIPTCLTDKNYEGFSIICSIVLRTRDVYPWSVFFPSRIQQQKEEGKNNLVFCLFSYIFHYILLSSQKYGLDPKSWIRKNLSRILIQGLKKLESRIQSRNSDYSFTLLKFSRSGSPGLGCGSGKLHRYIQKSTNFLFYFLFSLPKKLSVLYTSYGLHREKTFTMVTIKYLLSYNRLTIHITVRERRREWKWYISKGFFGVN